MTAGFLPPRSPPAGYDHFYLPLLPLRHRTLMQESVGYDIYDHWDLGEFDQRGSARTVRAIDDLLPYTFLCSPFSFRNTEQEPSLTISSRLREMQV